MKDRHRQTDARRLVNERFIAWRRVRDNLLLDRLATQTGLTKRQNGHSSKGREGPLLDQLKQL